MNGNNVASMVVQLLDMERMEDMLIKLQIMEYLAQMEYLEILIMEFLKNAIILIYTKDLDIAQMNTKLVIQEEKV